MIEVLEKKLYIPLCLYFNLREPVIEVLEKKLYIPLCLYFNGNCGASSATGDYFTFHYVSILI